MKINPKSQAFVIEPSQDNFFYGLGWEAISSHTVFATRMDCEMIHVQLFYSSDGMNCIGDGDHNHKWLLVRVSDDGKTQEGWGKHIKRNS